MVDISFQGATLKIKCPYITQNGAADVLLDFGDEGSPVEFQNVDTVGVSGNMNGVLITWTRYQPIQFDVTLISGSKADKALRQLLYAQHVGGQKRGTRKADLNRLIISEGVLSVPSIYTEGENVRNGGKTKYTLKLGRMTAGIPGQGANAEGKMSSRRYHFVFESGAVME